MTVSGSIGNGLLTYPIGLITSDEATYAGAAGSATNTTWFLYSGSYYYWTMSPYGKIEYSSTTGTSIYSINNSNRGIFVGANNNSWSNKTKYVRPVIS